MAAEPFNLIKENTSYPPHRFRAYRYDRSNGDCWRAVVDGFLEARKLTASAFYGNVTDTGFRKFELDKHLNVFGRDLLPATPPEDSNITRNPSITDMTEVLSLEVLKWSEAGFELPYPRVLHKESYPLQHHGIDSLGYTEQNGEYTLYIIEVMASVDSAHPPRTVKDHLKQILPDTINAPSLERLLKDLQTVHDEAKDDKDRTVLNGFIVAALNGSLSKNQAAIASPVLIRRINEFHENDWKPFIDSKSEFESATLPSTVLFIAVECHKTFSGLLDLIKQAASGQVAPVPELEGGEE